MSRNYRKIGVFLKKIYIYIYKMATRCLTLRVKDDGFKIFYGTNSPHTSGAHTTFYKLHTSYSKYYARHINSSL